MVFYNIQVKLNQ